MQQVHSEARNARGAAAHTLPGVSKYALYTVHDEPVLVYTVPLMVAEYDAGTVGRTGVVATASATATAWMRTRFSMASTRGSNDTKQHTVALGARARVCVCANNKRAKPHSRSAKVKTTAEQIKVSHRAWP
jgi:hypothetical protein